MKRVAVFAAGLVCLLLAGGILVYRQQQAQAQPATIYESTTLYAEPVPVGDGILWIGAIEVEGGYQTWLVPDSASQFLTLSRRATMEQAKADVEVISSATRRGAQRDEVAKITMTFDRLNNPPHQLTTQHEAAIVAVMQGTP